jgi:phenylalanyl-tRNA synthetase alpha chain
MANDSLRKVLAEASEAISHASDITSLDLLRVKYLGRKGLVTEILKSLSDLPEAERPELGKQVNETKEKIQAFLHDKLEKLKAEEIAKNLAQEVIDVTLPGYGQELGSLHPLTKTRYKIEDFFYRLGFTALDGPEVEDDYHNFGALNFPLHHPARHMQDTFYLPNNLLLRTHTSTVQIRAMENGQPPFRLIASGRVYRRDNDATHSPMFHQLEGLVVTKTANFAELKWLMQEFVADFFGPAMKLRFRASYFPFTEPSAELDILWSGNEKMRWLECAGCGMVHPNVLKAVGIDSEIYSGFAFGLGLDRLAMLRYGISDLRLFFESDIKFLEQF